jgi:hypothetical protein
MQVTIDIGSAVTVIGVIAVLGAALVFIVLLVGRVRNFFASRKFDGTDREAMRARWREIERMIGGQGEMNRKVAILEADKLLDHALKSLAMPGMSLGERLKFAQYKYPELRDVWWAHKVRNQLAHEASYHVDPGVAKRAIASFRKALERLGAI